MMKFQDSYNPKVDFRFLAFTNMNINQYESTYNLRKVFNEEMEAITKDQIDLIKSKQAFKILKQEGINNKSLKKCCKPKKNTYLCTPYRTHNACERQIH